MAIRKEAWLAVKDSVCHLGGIHEDFDLAIHLQAAGYKVKFYEQIEAGVSSRRIHCSFKAFMRYAWISPATYLKHGLNIRRQFYPVLAVAAVGYWPGYILHKAYNPKSGRLSLLTLTQKNKISRVDPTANVF